MDNQFKLILENEIINRQKGEWFLAYCSSTTYYRLRKQAYKIFINELDK